MAAGNLKHITSGRRWNIQNCLHALKRCSGAAGGTHVLWSEGEQNFEASWMQFLGQERES